MQKIRGKRHWLWRALDQDGIVLDILVQGRRDQQATERFLRRVIEGEGGMEPRVGITDKLARYPPAIRQVLPHTDHRRPKRLNNRAENSHLPPRGARADSPTLHIGRPRAALPWSVRAVCNHFRPRRPRLTASTYRQIRTERHIVWQDITLGRVRP